jgi:tetratricopeptide (TPR) repeat protein
LITPNRALRKLALGLFLSLCLAATFAQTRANAIEEIAAALRANEFDHALELSRAALKQAPGNAELWTMQGAAYAGNGNKSDALASYKSALKIAPDYIPAIHGAVQIEYEANDVAAIPLLQRLLRSNPDDRISHGMLAVLEYQRGNYTAAAANFEKTGSLFDSQLEGLHAWAACLVKLKRYDQAVDIFQRAVNLNPADDRERHLLASLQLMAHKPEDALVTLKPLIEAAKPSADTLELASSAYEDAKDTEAAVGALRQAILLDPNNVNLYLDFANISAAHQSFQVGVNVVNDGIAVLPKAAPLYFARGVLYAQSGQYANAQADFETAYKMDPSQSLTAAAQGLAAVQASDLDGALNSVQSKLAQKPSDPLLLYLQADILSQRGADPGTTDFQLAMRSAKKAVALRPTLAAARSVLAKLYLQAGQYPEAVEQSRKALSLDPKDQAAAYHLIQGLRKTGDTKEIPALLKQLATLRAQATKEESERNRFKLVEGDVSPKQP